jgi:FixJ family two-component response regulator
MTPTICVVDDDRSVRRALQRLLQAAGYRVFTFGSAGEFMQFGTVPRPACLVIDVQMPGRTGADLYKQLCHTSCDVPVIFISGHADSRAIARITREMSTSFLSKPFEDEALLELLGRAVEADRRKLADALPAPVQSKA